MDRRQRSVYPTAKQKKKLIELMVKHPELVSTKVTQDFNFKDSQELWQSVANQCNAIPGARKTWRQWKKTWQDIRCKTKKRLELSGEIPPSATLLTAAEREALGLKDVSSTTSYQDSTEFVPLNMEMDEDNVQDRFGNEEDSIASHSEGESVQEEKVFTSSINNTKKTKNTNNISPGHSDSCIFNCDMLAIQEQKKLQIKEDYYTFKKDYLSQKLLLLKEQTEALKDIAKELAK